MLFLSFLVCLEMGCVFAPYAPKDRGATIPQGESQPVPAADSNPLDTPRFVSVVCGPQGTPIVATEAVLDCEADPACQVRCAE